MVHTPVGARCRECANVRRIPTYNISGAVLGRAAGSSLGAGVAVGVAWWLFNPLTCFFFYGVLTGLAFGYAIGELVSLGTGRRAGPPLQAMAAGGVVLAYLVRVGLLFGASSWAFSDLRLDLCGLVAVTIAGFIAAGRLR